MFENSKWIWAEDNAKKNDRIIARCKFTLEKIPKGVTAYIGASDHYNMYLNDKLVVLRGGLNRESTPKNGYYDEIDITKNLVKGDNALVFMCSFIGESGNGMLTCGASGLIVDIPELNVNSNSGFSICRYDGYVAASDPKPDVMYAGENFGYDASKGGDISNVCGIEYSSTMFIPATEYASYGDAPYGELYSRGIPLFAFSQTDKLKFSKVVDGATATYTAPFPAAAFVQPIISLNAMGTEKLCVKADRYISQVNGISRNNLRVEYTCKNGAQTFECDELLAGAAIVVIAPTSVKINTISVRYSNYDTQANTLETSEPRLDKLISKCENTLEFCMRDSLIDSPEYSRGVNLAQVSTAARAALLRYDERVLPLVKKTILDFALFSSTALKNNALGTHASETPYDSLVALSELGVIKAYYDFSGDSELITKIYASLAEYLLLWEYDGACVSCRDGDKTTFDDGYNIDSYLIENCLYYSACKFLLDMASVAAENKYADELRARCDSISRVFESKFWKGCGYSSCDFYDDRANAIAALVGLADSAHNGELTKLFTSVNMASAQNEGFVIAALAKVGGASLAQDRLIARYTNFIDSENPTLSFGFGDGGQLAYSGSVSPLSIILECFGGVRLMGGKRVELAPNLGKLTELKFTFSVIDGKISVLCRKNSRDEEKIDVIIENNSLLDVQMERYGKIIKINKGKTKYND